MNRNKKLESGIIWNSKCEQVGTTQELEQELELELEQELEQNQELE